VSFPTRALSPIAAAVLISISGLVTAQTTQPPPSAVTQQAFDIPALPAAQALQRFVEQTKFQLLYLPDVVSGVTTNPINGTMTARDALERMLKGTGVTIVDTGAGAATLRPLGAAASNAPSGDAAGAQGAVSQLQSVIVTASKRATPERQLAGSVTALQGSDLEARGAVGFEEYLRQAPGVQYNKQEAGYATLSIRGLTTSTTFGTSQGTTGIYIEDVPFTDPFSVIALPDLGAFDLERIEVLRGPQGVLFGSASLGGALKFVLNKPNLKGNEASGEITGSQTSGGGANYGVSAMGNWASSSQDFGLRIVGYDRKDSGYVKNVTTGDERINSARQTGGRILATWKPLQQLSITGILMSEEGKLDDSSSVSPDPAKFETNVQTRQPRTLKTDFGNLQVNYDFESIRLTSNTGYVGKGTEVATDLGRAGIGSLFANQATDLQAFSSNSAHAFSQEFRLANRETGNVNWLVGAFYQEFKQHYGGGFVGNGVSAAAQTLYGPAFGVPLVQSLTANDSFYAQDISSVAKETALFGDLEWRVTPRWTVEGGGRAYRTQMTQDSTTSGLLSFLSFGTEPKHANDTTSDHGITPKVSIKYTAENGDIWYALASNGYRFGGLNFVPPAPGLSNPTSFKSDKLWNYETGVRLSMLDRRLFADLTAFYMDWKDAQFTAARADGFGYVDNVGKARSLGAEAALRYRATGNLTLGAGFAYTDAKTKVDSSMAPAGARLPGTAHLQGLLDASYNFAGPFESLGTATLTYSHVGKYYSDLQQTVQLGSYGIADLNVRFAYDKYELTLFARNLANEKGKIGAAAAPGLGYADYYLTKPRTIGVTLRVDL